VADLLMPPPPGLDWTDLREGCHRVARFLAPKARHHSEWKLGFDLQQAATQITVREEDVAPGDTDDVGKVHSFMLGLERVEPVVNADGQPTEMGGEGYEYDVTFAFWGFWDATLRRGDGFSGQRLAEVESELMVAGFYKNRRLGLDPPKVSLLTRLGMLRFGPVDVHNFTEGVDAWVAQGSITARVQRTL
jgi:hypothetical protein